MCVGERRQLLCDASCVWERERGQLLCDASCVWEVSESCAPDNEPT